LTEGGTAFAGFATAAGFATGAGDFSAGAGDFSTGAGDFATGAGDFATGAGDFTTGAGDFTTGAGDSVAGAGAAFPTLIAPCGSILGRREGVRAERSAADSDAAWFRGAAFAMLECCLLDVSEPLTRRELRAGVSFDIRNEG
jgi:hypothetical protein